VPGICQSRDPSPLRKGRGDRGHHCGNSYAFHSGSEDGSTDPRGQTTPASTPPAGVKLTPRRCWNHHVDGTPYNIPGTQSFDPTKPTEKSDPVPNPKFSPQGDIHYFQGDIGTHGLHVMLIADSDNAQQTVPIDELDSEQIQVILPGRQANVGEAYGRAFEKPLATTAAPADGLQVENVAAPAAP